MNPSVPVVLLHGWGLNPAVWQPWSAHLARPLVSLALPGHGGAPWSGQRTLAEWAARALEQAPPRAVWLGWSLGGLVVLQAALLAPARVVAMVLLASTPRFVQADDWPAAMPAEVLAAFHTDLTRAPADTLHRFLVLQTRGASAARDTLRRLRADLSVAPPPDPDALAVGLELLRASDLRAALPAIAVPTLWLCGARDTLVPAAVAPAVARLMPASRQQVLPDAGHAPWLAQPVATAAAVVAFLAEHAA